MANLDKYLVPSKKFSVKGCFLPLTDTLGMNLVTNDYQVAILGAPIVSGNTDSDLSTDAIRKQLYELSFAFQNIRIADLGDVRCDSERGVSYALTETIKELTEANVITIVLGGSHELTECMFEGVEGVKDSLRLTIVDSKIDERETSEKTADAFLGRLLDKPQLEELNLLGLQNYYCSENQLRVLRDRECCCMRLRDLRGKTVLAEPLLRDSEMFSFDFSSVRQSDAPDRRMMIPNGFSSLEACELAHYAGLSDCIQSYGLFGFESELKEESQTAALAAQMVWHILKGIDNRYHDYPYKDISEYKKYIIFPKVEGEDAVYFYHNMLNGRWWIEIPTLKGKTLFSCSPSDYQNMLDGSIPDIWMKHFMK